ncbi:MAG: hypothetical protein NDI84_06885 [Steroidobacteraceae bacterium]|nr:hypothetical protein [Steroidobacteraceae bacterium]
MTLRPDPKYTNRRTYVLKLGSDALPDSLSGRLENLVTGAQLDFSNAGELLDTLASDLAACGDAASARRTGD